jgi:DNA/RNA-binding domain of Phe-tRNA-synthetase-like protein
MTIIHIHEDILEAYPTFRRGIVVATNIRNQGHSEALEEMLKQVVGEAAERPVDLKADPRTVVWSEAHRQFGSNPNKFPPAHCALLKRVQRPGVQIPFINKVVAIMNFNSIKDITPVGGDDLDRAGERLELRYATGKEVFTPLGTPEKSEHPDPGEIIYVIGDSNEVMCRRWNWRNGHGTRIMEETRTMVMNIDGLGDGIESKTIMTRDRVAAMLEEFCQAETETALLSPGRPSFEFTI